MGAGGRSSPAPPAAAAPRMLFLGPGIVCSDHRPAKLARCAADSQCALCLATPGRCCLVGLHDTRITADKTPAKFAVRACGSRLSTWTLPAGSALVQGPQPAPFLPKPPARDAAIPLKPVLPSGGHTQAWASSGFQKVVPSPLKLTRAKHLPTVPFRTCLPHLPSSFYVHGPPSTIRAASLPRLAPSTHQFV